MFCARLFRHDQRHRGFASLIDRRWLSSGLRTRQAESVAEVCGGRNQGAWEQRLSLRGTRTSFGTTACTCLCCLGVHSLPECPVGVTVQDAVTHVLGQEPVYFNYFAIPREPLAHARLVLSAVLELSSLPALPTQRGSPRPLQPEPGGAASSSKSVSMSGVHVRLTVFTCSGGCRCCCFARRFDCDAHNVGSRVQLNETLNEHVTVVCVLKLAMAEQLFASKHRHFTPQLCVVREIFPPEPHSFLKSVLLDLKRFTPDTVAQTSLLGASTDVDVTPLQHTDIIQDASAGSKQVFFTKQGWAMRCSSTNARVLWTSSAGAQGARSTRGAMSFDHFHQRRMGCGGQCNNDHPRGTR